MKKTFVVSFLMLISLVASAQKDTICIVQYNLLNYGDASRTTAYKNTRLSTILNAAKPDILGVNELRKDSTNAQKILDSVLGADWTRGKYINTRNEIQYNCLFWNKKKFGLRRQFSISSNLRDIIAYELYYLQTPSAVSDTVSFTVIVAHLKASNTPSDASARAAETQTVKNYLNNLGRGGNYIFMGDMNVYTSSEDCYQNLVANTNPNGRLYDPVNRPGNWSANGTFADVHTQSTRTSQLSDDGATGGLDDRFDQILVSGYIMGDSAGMKYLPGSYKAFGQDGQHYNKSIVAAPANSAVPQSVAQALYEMSDHLPITARFVISSYQRPNAVAHVLTQPEAIKVINPFYDKLILSLPEPWKGQPFSYTLVGTDGRVINSGSGYSGYQEEIIPVHTIAPGIYFLQLRSSAGSTSFHRLLHVQ